MKLLSIAYDFSCSFDFKKAVYRFEGYEFAFHAGDSRRCSVIETLLKENQDVDEVINIANRFCLSLLEGPFFSFQFIQASVLGGIRKDVDLLAKEPFACINPKSDLIRHSFPSSIRPLETDDQLKAYSLYNDSLFTENLLLKIICLWKVLEIPNRKGQTPVGRVNEILSKNRQIRHNHLILSEMEDNGGDVGLNMKNKYRHAVTHISRPPHYSSHRFEDWVELRKAAMALQDIAWAYIGEKIGVPRARKLELLRIVEK